VACAVGFAVLTAPLFAQVPTPESVIGFRPGTDYKLADYGLISEYFSRLDAASDRMVVNQIGTTAEGRPMMLAVISSEENLRQLDRWKDIARRLAMAEGLSDQEARRLAREGRAVVWIDGGLHATEVAHGQHTSLLAHHLVTSEDDEVRKIRDQTVILLMPVMNPDGLELVTDWYSRNVGTAYETSPMPVLYHKYVGHDNNRDWYMTLQPESRAVANQLWHEWFPQIVYNHHQTGPIPSRIFIPPFKDPMNPNIPPLVMRGINLVGSAMGLRFAQEGKPGAVSRVSYTVWWNGGMRTAPYFHNQVGILTETNLYRYATPHYYEPDELPTNFREGMSGERPSVFYPNPWKGGWWRLGDAVEYMLTASMAVAKIGADLREDWLYNIYLMGTRAIERGREGRPFAYVIPREQWDGGEALELVNVLRRGGVDVERATRAFSAGGMSFAAGSYVAFAAQPFRAHLVDLMEPQTYPDRRVFPGGPPDPPYDMAGWTLPMQMGVTVHRIEESFRASTEPVTTTSIVAEAGSVSGQGPVFLLTPNENNSVIAVNKLLADGATVSRAGSSFESGGSTWPVGTFIVRGNANVLRSTAQQTGLDFVGAGSLNVNAMQVRQPRVGLYKSWVSNMDEGWTRWILENYEFQFENLADADLRSGNLSRRFDVIILPDQDANRILNGHTPGTIPDEYAGGLSSLGAANLKQFVEDGGTLIAMDHAADFAIDQLGLPVRNVVRNLDSEQFFIPGSLIRLDVDNADPVAAGVQENAAAFFVESQAFSIIPPAAEGDQRASRNVDVVARYAADDLLMSGWELGAERYLAGRAAVLRVPTGRGHVVLIGFRSQFRGQPRGTFKLLFNAILFSTMEMPPEAADDVS
jgi:hypothetical protein